MIVNVSTDFLSTSSQPGTLLYRHPLYDRRWWWWEFGRVSYKGGREYQRPTRLSVDFDYPVIEKKVPVATSDGVSASAVTSFHLDVVRNRSLLFRHNREQSWEFENRRRRAHYYNFPRTIVNSLVSHATKRGANRTGDDLMMGFWKATDCKRTQSIDEFIRRGLRWAQVKGIMWACVDVDTDGDGDGKPYAYWVSPLDILDWEVDSDGDIVWLKQFVYTETTRKWNEKVVPRFRFRIWTKDDVTTYETDVNGSGMKTIDDQSRKHGLGRVPFEPLYSLRDDESPFPDGEPLVGDLCKSSNVVYNSCSLLDEIINKQTFSWLAIPDPNVDVIEMGVNTAFGYDPNGTSAVPTYVSPDPRQAQVIMQVIEATIEQARQAVGVGRGRNEGSMQKPSADALELESEDKRSILGDMVTEASGFERRLASLVEAYRKTKTVGTKMFVDYSREFDLHVLQEEIDEALSLKSIPMSPEINQELAKQLARRKFAGMEPDKLDELVDTLTDELFKTPPPPKPFVPPLDNQTVLPPLDNSGTPVLPSKNGQPAADKSQGNGSPRPTPIAGK